MHGSYDIFEWIYVILYCAYIQQGMVYVHSTYWTYWHNTAHEDMYINHTDIKLYTKEAV